MVTVAIMLPVLLTLAVFAINLAYVQVINTKVQIVTDAAARASGRVYGETQNEEEALAAAQQMAALNPIESIVVTLEASDLEFGLSERKTKDQAYSFKVAEKGNSVRVTTKSFADGAGACLHAFFPAFSGTLDIRPQCVATHSQTTLDVAVIVDRSGSMAFAANENSRGQTPQAAPDGWSYGDPVPPNSRWLDLVVSVDSFCNELTNTAKTEKVGLVSYSNYVTRDVNLTDQYALIHDSNQLISHKFSGGMTNVGGGILEGIATVTEPKHCRPWATNALVLMSDGNHNTGTAPLTAAAEAAKLNIPIYTVSFSAEADTVLMQQIADMTGGTHYHAIDAQQLNEAFRKIARRLPSMLTQ